VNVKGDMLVRVMVPEGIEVGTRLPLMPFEGGFQNVTKLHGK